MSYVPMIDSRQLTLYQMTMTLQFTYTSKIGILKSLDTIILCAPAMVTVQMWQYTDVGLTGHQIDVALPKLK